MSLKEYSKTKFLGLLPLFLIVAIGTFLRFADIAQESVWLDEAFSVFMAYNEPSMIMERSIGDNHPPLYYLLLHFWMELTGSSETMIRIPSALFGIGLIPLIYLIGRRLFSEKVGLLAAFFTALSPILIWYSQEARSYTMVAFFALLSFWSFYEAMLSRRPVFWVVFSVATALMFYSHYFSFFFAAIEAVIFFLLWKRKDWTQLKHALLAGLGTVLLYLPWIATVIHRKVGDPGALYWATTNEHTLKVTLLHFAGGNPNSYLLAWYPQDASTVLAMILLPTVAAIGILIAWQKKELRKYVALLLLSIIPGTIAYSLTNHYHPMYHTRFFIYSVPFVFLAFSYGLANIGVLLPSRQWPWKAAVISSAVIIGSSVLVLVMFNTLTQMHGQLDKEDWNGATSYVLENAQPGDVIVTEPRYFLIPVSYYMGLSTTPSEFSSDVNGGKIHFYGNDFFYGTDISRQMQAISSNAPRIWRLSANYSPKEIETWLESNYVNTTKKEFSQLQVTLYQRR